MTPHSRRQFITRLGQGAALAFSLPALGGLSRPLGSAFPAEDKRLGVALVGLGNYATGQLAPALQQTQKCYLAGIVTGTPEKAARWKEQYHIPEANCYTYDTFDRIRNNPSIDIIYIVLPNSMHHDYVLRAARTGKHVICEKPMGLSVKECEEMIAACKTAGVMLSIGYRIHFEPFNMEAARIGQKKVYGAVKMVDAGFGFPIGDPTQWRLKKAMAGGGAVMDVGIYAIQAARYVTGEEPVSITAQEFKTDPVKFKEVDETVTWQLEFPSGAMANCTTSYSFGINQLFVRAEKGWVEIEPSFNYTVDRGMTSDRPMNFKPVNQQAGQLDNFASCILTGTPSSVSGEEGLKDLRVIEALYASIASGKKVRIGA